MQKFFRSPLVDYVGVNLLILMAVSFIVIAIINRHKDRFACRTSLVIALFFSAVAAFAHFNSGFAPDIILGWAAGGTIIGLGYLAWKFINYDVSKTKKHICPCCGNIMDNEPDYEQYK